MRAIEPLRRSTDEIVRDILRKLGGDPALDQMIRKLIDGLCLLGEYGPLTGYRKDNEKFARRLRKWVEDGEKLFAAVPENFNVHMLFAPEDYGPLDTPERVEAMAMRAEEGHATLRAWLTTLRSRCEWIIQAKIGEHRHAGYNQERAAIAARELCERAGKPVAPSSPTSAYREVAGLLFEAMTGEHGRDMERACEFIAPRPVIGTEKR